MRQTGIVSKVLPSIINVLVTFVLAFPFLFLYGLSPQWKITWIAIFLAYNLFFEFFFGRCLGMFLIKTRYNTSRSALQILIYIILYTASFSTLLFSIWFSFDLLLINLLILQVPCILLTGTTLHGYVSGKITTVYARDGFPLEK